MRSMSALAWAVRRRRRAGLRRTFDWRYGLLLPRMPLHALFVRRSLEEEPEYAFYFTYVRKQ